MRQTEFVICIDDSEYPVSLEKRKIYEVLADEDAATVGQLRVIDESGENYLYPARCFVEANLTKKPDRLS